MSLSGVISGVVICIIGFFIIASGFFKDSPMFIFILIGILFIGTGIYMKYKLKNIYFYFNYVRNH